jgi:ATP-binding cassette subfamily C protein CydD
MPNAEQVWLEAAAAPGRGRLTVAAACQTSETIFTILVWAALAVIAEGSLLRNTPPSWPELAALFGGGLVAAGAAWSAARFQAAGRWRIGRAIRQRLVDSLLPSGQRRGEADAATAALASVELTDDIADYHAQTFPQRMSAPASMAVIFLITAVVLWPAAVILLLASLLIPPNMRLVGMFGKEGADERLAASTRLGAVVLDSFRGLRTLQSIGAVARRREELVDAAASLNATTMAIVRRASLSGTVMEVVITFSIAVDATYIGLSLLGYLHIGFLPAVTLFSGLLALLLCPMYFQPIRAMAAAYHSRERALSAVPILIRLLVEQDEAAAVAMPVRKLTAPSPAGPVAVRIDDVSVRFPNSDEPLLQQLDLTFEPGRWTAIAGPSGSGKTTLLSLVVGVRQPTSGTVRWITHNGVMPPHLGGSAWIGQQTVLLPGSIRDNIRIGRPSAGQTEVERAVAAAALSDVVARLPEGLDTTLGEGGSGLSTGEARRIAIARAFLRNAELWVLDEPTAHLDSRAEAQVLDALRNATRGKTVIVATHSAAVARSADALLSITDRTIHALPEAIPA